MPSQLLLNIVISPSLFTAMSSSESWYIKGTRDLDLSHYASNAQNVLRASPPMLSMRLQTVKFIVKKSKCAGLAQEIGFSASNSCSMP
jgi:hypothetical protein